MKSFYVVSKGEQESRWLMTYNTTPLRELSSLFNRYNNKPSFCTVET